LETLNTAQSINQSSSGNICVIQAGFWNSVGKININKVLLCVVLFYNTY